MISGMSQKVWVDDDVVESSGARWFLVSMLKKSYVGVFWSLKKPVNMPELKRYALFAFRSGYLNFYPE